MFNSYPRYVIIPEEAEDETADAKTAAIQQKASRLWGARVSASLSLLSLTVNILFLLLVVRFLYQNKFLSYDASAQRLYSPALTSREYTLKTFEPSFHSDGLFSGLPTPEVDARWRQLYRVGNSRLTKSEAAQLPNKTIAAQPGVDDDYLVVISAFHDLHCLDRLRQTLWYFHLLEWNATHNPFTVQRPSEYTSGGLNGIVHLDHCVNTLRQSLQCFSDPATYVFQWNEEAQEVRAQANIVHECRDFDAMREWALGRTYTMDWDRSGRRDEQGGCKSNEEGQCSNIA